MIHTIKDLKNHLAEKKNSPVFLLMGDEPFLLKKSMEMIMQKIVPSKEYKDFNFNIFDCKTASAFSIKETVETLPVFCDKRLVVCSSAHLLKEKDWKGLWPIIENPVQTAVLVFSADKWDKRKKFSKLLMEKSFVVENKQPSAKELSRWVRWLCRGHQLELSDSASELLIQLAGPGLMNLDSELGKIKAFVGSRTRVESEDILKTTKRLKPENVFSFTEAIGRRDVQQSFHCLVNLLEDQQSEAGLIALVARHIRIISQIKQGLKEGLTSTQISLKTGVPVFFLKDYFKQAVLWNDQKIFQMTEILHATDKALKSSPLSSDIWMENFVFKACSL